jgi:hypothetical protein
MNKDVIYIEPEDDITDIIAKVKNAKTKIVALVPPKKAGVLRSVVNFKLIAKTALQHNKTVVLISTDENLVKFAQSVKMPVAKSLSSKPQLATDDETEFGDADEESDIIEEEPEPETETSTSKSEKKDVKSDHEKSHKDDKKVEAGKVKKSEEVVTEDEIDEEADTDKKAAKKKSNQKVPNIKKYRTQIIIGSVFAVIMVVVLIWAFAFAPAAKVIVHVRTSDQGFSETIKLTTDQDKEDIDAGIFYMEEKAIEKTASADFEATGEVDKGTKASGTLTVKRTSPVVITDNNGRAAITIPVGTKFTYNGLTYVSTAASTLRNVEDADLDPESCKVTNYVATCDIAKDISTTVKVEASENGDKYNTNANSGWTVSVGSTTVTASSISGGASKIVKIVSKDDLAAAEENLDITGESDAKKELIDENSDDAIVIKSSFNIENGQLSSSPALGEEVNGDTKPKVTKKTTYKVYTVSRDVVSQYIEKTVEEGLGDDTRTVYATGAGKDEEKVIAFFESYKNNNGEYTAKLKSTVKIGPRVTPEMISEKILGQKVGQVRTMLTSINGVADVEINRSYFWVTKIPSDINKVEIEITVD